MSLWGKLVGIFYVFCSMLLRKRILLDFLGFCASTFFMLRTLLQEVSDVVSFYVREYVSFFIDIS